MSKTDTRVLLIAPEPFFEARGTPMNVLQMCRVLTGAGYQVDLATYPIGSPIEMPGLTVHRCLRVPGIRSVPIGFSWRKVILDFFLFWTVLRLVLTRRPTIVHAVEESVFLALPFTYFGKPLIYDLDSLISDQLHYTGAFRSPTLLAWIRRLERLALRRSTAAIGVCKSLTDAAAELCPDARLFRVEDAPLSDSLRKPEPERVAAIREELGLGGLRPIVYTGNLEPYQGIDLLVEATPTLISRFPDARVVIVGGSPERLQELRSRLEAEHLSEAILAVGARPPAEMPEWMALGELLVSPRSHGSNTPLKLYTYMHAERPIVATDRLTHTQVLDSNTAFLSPPEPVAFAEAMAAGLADPAEAQRRAEAAHSQAVAEYSPEAFRRKLLATYQQILA